MNEVTKIDIACGWDEEREALVTQHVHDGQMWSVFGKLCAGVIINATPECFESKEQDDSVLGLIGATFQEGSIVSIDDWKLYDADFDAPQELLDQLQAWAEYEVTEDASEINIPTPVEVSPEWKEKIEEAIKEALGIQPKTTMQRLKDIAISLAVSFGLSVLATLTSTLIFMFAVINMHKNVEHIMEFGMGGAEYLTSALALMLFAMAWFATERMFSWVWEKK